MDPNSAIHYIPHHRELALKQIYGGMYGLKLLQTLSMCI